MHQVDEERCLKYEGKLFSKVLVHLGQSVCGGYILDFCGAKSGQVYERAGKRLGQWHGPTNHPHSSEAQALLVALDQRG